MGDSGALTLGFVARLARRRGRAEDAGDDRAAAPLLIMAVPIVDTSFVVAKRLKYRRKPWDPDQNHFHYRFLRIGYSQRRTAAYLHLWALVLAAYAMLVRFVPPRPGGELDVSHAVIVGLVGIASLVGSVWMVYQLEILKARHFEALGLKRPPPSVEEADRAVEEVLHAGPPPSPEPTQQVRRIAGDRRAPRLGSRRLRHDDIRRVAQHLQPPLPHERLVDAAHRPSNIVHTGVPSAAASRFIDPPARPARRRRRRASATSTARGGHDHARQAERPHVGGLLGVARRARPTARPRRRGVEQPGRSGVSLPPR